MTFIKGIGLDQQGLTKLIDDLGKGVWNLDKVIKHVVKFDTQQKSVKLFLNIGENTRATNYERVNYAGEVVEDNDPDAEYYIDHEAGEIYHVGSENEGDETI